MFDKEEYWRFWTSQELFEDNKKRCLVDLHRYQNCFAILENYSYDNQIQDILKDVDRSDSKAVIKCIEKAIYSEEMAKDLYTSLTSDTQKKPTKRLKI